jgi:hypothetical protein
VATDAGTVAVAPTAGFASGRDLLGQPRGLFFIGATELWERISFHGMQAILVLYMAEQLLLPGHVENIVGFTGLRAAIGLIDSSPITGSLTLIQAANCRSVHRSNSAIGFTRMRIESASTAKISRPNTSRRFTWQPSPK